MFVIDSACGCHIGKIRTNNEDNFFFTGSFLGPKNSGLNEVLVSSVCTEEAACYAVFDGMGGERDGEVASFLAAQELKNREESLRSPDLQPDQFLMDTCMAANKAVYREADRNGGYVMGSTAVMLCFLGESVHICNVGDSRAYRLRQNELRQLSVDHTDQALLEKQGIFNRKPRLFQYLGIRPDEMRIEPNLVSGEIQSEDQYLICSDGLTDMLSVADISRILKNTDTRKSVEELMEQSLARGGKDNITVILCRVMRQKP